MEHIEIEYNQELKQLEAVLSEVKQPGDFFVCGAMEIPMPRVEIGGAGTLSFPVPDGQIAALVREARRAPYGRGQETIVDTSVRNVWQIGAEKIKIEGKSWEANFENILAKAKAGLGCGDAIVTAELYKLLVYDCGGFFLPHRDTEKTDGMFGTLVVTLPSTYRGGALRVIHAGREVTLETHPADPSELSYIAFYADCEHEALPVREGNRICLVYNLIHKHAKGSRQSVLKAPEYESQITEAAVILDRFLKASDAPAKLAWLLEHQYSPAGLSFSALKGADLAKARVLVRAAARAQCAAHLGIVHIGESGAAEPDSDYFYGCRHHRYRYYEDAEVEEGYENAEELDDDKDASFTVATVDDTWRYVDEWRESDDRAIQYGRIPLASGELLPAGALDGEPPDEKRLTEASGNEGATYERSYHRAALVLWRRNRTLDVLLQAGVGAALPYLRQLAAGGKHARSEAIVAAERMLEAWPRDALGWDSYSVRRGRPRPPERIEMIAALTKLKVPTLIERFIREAVASSYDDSEKAALVASLSLLGATKAAAVVSELVMARMPERPNEVTELLLALSENPSLCFPEIAEAAIAALDRIGRRDSEPKVFAWDKQERPRALGPQFLENLLRTLQRFKGGTLCGAAAEKIASRPETFSPVAMVVPVIERICAERQKTAAVDKSVRPLWTNAAEFLLRCSEVPPAPPSDWRLKVRISCSCPDCRELESFAHDPVERVHRFRVKKERRQHLHQTIDRYGLEMTHVTEHVGSPQTLVCTKDRRSFNLRMKEYREEISAMRTLVRLAPKSGGAALSRRMEVAAKRVSDLKQEGAPADK